MINTARLAVPALLAAAVVGCAARSVQIADLKRQPDRYDERTISVTGVVTNSFGIPLVPFQLYNIDDGTGEITVLSRSGRAPTKGARVQVTGTVNDVGVLRGRSVGLHIQESERRVKS